VVCKNILYIMLLFCVTVCVFPQSWWNDSRSTDYFCFTCQILCTLLPTVEFTMFIITAGVPVVLKFKIVLKS